MLPLDLFIIRHGESEGNRALRKYEENSNCDFPAEFLNRHQTDLRLTDKGKAQAQVTGNWLKNWLKENNLPRFDRHFVSTHTRTLETAALLDLPDVEWKPTFQLRERDVGIWGSIPDKNWQKQWNKSFRLNQNHRFYTPMPNGESIANVCDRLRNFINALDRDSEDVNRKRVVIVTHGDATHAFRVILEHISPNTYDELVKANLPDFRIGNGQIVHYTRIEPHGVSEFRAMEYERVSWVRSINPWKPDFAGHDWRPIKQRRYTNDELLAMVNRFPRLIND